MINWEGYCSNAGFLKTLHQHLSEGTDIGHKKTLRPRKTEGKNVNHHSPKSGATLGKHLKMTVFPDVTLYSHIRKVYSPL